MWKEEIWLVIHNGNRTVSRMTKRMPEIKRGEVPIKVVVEVDERAFRQPTLIRHVKIEDWREGLDMGDIDFKQAVISEQEAEIIRARRRQAMVEQLKELGYQIVAPPEEAAPEA